MSASEQAKKGKATAQHCCTLEEWLKRPGQGAHRQSGHSFSPSAIGWQTELWINTRNGPRGVSIAGSFITRSRRDELVQTLEL
jgi:hypothetical protein